jgi:hypothetical protein
MKIKVGMKVVTTKESQYHPSKGVVYAVRGDDEWFHVKWEGLGNPVYYRAEEIGSLITLHDSTRNSIAAIMAEPQL